MYLSVLQDFVHMEVHIGFLTIHILYSCRAPFVKMAKGIVKYIMGYKL